MDDLRRSSRRSESSERHHRRSDRRSRESYYGSRRFKSPSRRGASNTPHYHHRRPPPVGTGGKRSNDPSSPNLRDPVLAKVQEAQDAERDDLTVLIRNVNPKATERDIWKFISAAGKVRDIQIIKDARSGRSKGVAYVELYTQAAVLAAIGLSGQEFMGMVVDISPSQAEKNRAAKASRQQQQLEFGPFKIYIGGLVGDLSYIEESDLKDMLYLFGNVLHVEIHKDYYTKRCKGYAFVTFSSATEAQEAIVGMHGMLVCGQKLTVGYVPSMEMPRIAPSEKSAVCLYPMFTLKQLETEGQNVLQEILDDIKSECEKFGEIEKIHASPTNPEGKVWIKYKTPTAAKQCQTSMHGRYFAGRRITITLVADWDANI